MEIYIYYLYDDHFSILSISKFNKSSYTSRLPINKYNLVKKKWVSGEFDEKFGIPKKKIFTFHTTEMLKKKTSFS